MNYTNTLDPQDLVALLATARVEFAKALHELKPALGLAVPHPLLESALKHAGIDTTRMRRQGYTAWVKLTATPALVANVNARSVYGGSVNSVSDRQHYLCLSNGTLWMKYQSIIGQWRLGDLDDQAFANLERTLTTSICCQTRYVAQFTPLAG